MRRGLLGGGWFRVQAIGAGAALSFMLALSGCGSFFQCEGKADCGTGSGGSGGGAGTGDYVYTTNAPNSLNAIAGYSISSSGTMTALTGSPFTVSSQPTTLAVSKNNEFLYTGSANISYPGIYVYSIASTGVLSIANSGNPVPAAGGLNTDSVLALAISPDGGWLFTVESNGIAYLLGEYQINSSGIPVFAGTFALPTGAVCTPTTVDCGVAIAPDGSFVVAFANNDGAYVYPFSSSNGIPNNPGFLAISAPNSNDGDYSVTVDSSDYMYFSQTTSISSYRITNTSSGLGATSISVNSPTFTTEHPHSIIVSNGYVYTANPGTNKMSAFSANAGNLTTAGSDVVGPTSVYAIGVDSTGNYLVAAGSSGSIGLQLFSVTKGALGNLNQNFPTNTGSTLPIAIALTH